MDGPDQSRSPLDGELQFRGGSILGELNQALSQVPDTSKQIDDALRTWLSLAVSIRRRYPVPLHEDAIEECARRLLASPIAQSHGDYVRTQMIYSLLEEDEPDPLFVIVCHLLVDGRANEATFGRMAEAACFPRLLDLTASVGGVGGDGEVRDRELHRLLLDLMYEMSRIQRMSSRELVMIDDVFIERLFGIIEGVSDDIDDLCRHASIRVLLVLSEQYMLASTVEETDPEHITDLTPSLTNRVIKCISSHGPSFRTFGHNLILLLNRETETSLQLLMLKLLYLLFTTRTTYEYLYTNDLKVLLDVIIRNLMDLPDEKVLLRHTYLRILYPLLAHTQLHISPYYKRDEILRVLAVLRRSDHNPHFAPVDVTTLRLVGRVSNVKWLCCHDSTSSGDIEMTRSLLGISLGDQQVSSNVSVLDVAIVTEKPSVQTPSRRRRANVNATSGRSSVSSSGTSSIHGVLRSELSTGHGTHRSQSPSGDRASSDSDMVAPSVTEQTPTTSPSSSPSPSPAPYLGPLAKKVPPAVPGRRRNGPHAYAPNVHANTPPPTKTPPKAPPPRRRGRPKPPTRNPNQTSAAENTGTET